MGIIVALIGAGIVTFRDLISKRLSFQMGGVLLAFSTFFYAIPFYLVALVAAWLLGFENFAFSKAFFLLVLLRASTDVFAEWMRMQAFRSGDISLVISYLSLSPVFLLITSPLITGDKVSGLGVLGVLVIVAGSLAGINRKTREQHANWKIAIAWSLGASFFYSLNSCFDRLAVQIASPLLSGFGMTFAAALFLAPLALRPLDARIQLKSNNKALSLRGLYEVCFMLCKLIALQYMQAPYVVGIMRISLVFSILAGHLVFKEPAVLNRLAAGSLILVGIVILAFA